ncbi:YdcF family protein [Prosthecochloris sp. N3]|uniref:YdcF family protein n=1 Tax=Prosthecochloris ethylica TaxID=2743976 RepID=A0ABR9XU35_9CHLB|nr:MULTISPECIES: YdcF family protein [Prosthecochloris]MEC9486939.1 YdcF family protein [Prosthecochloris sp.]MBF0587288.1 YdcF family protein [Prosthecochloris ethylica]MBF0637490.1 YdcF family protein [Prosthecochloris ethylica]NUK48096.1 YdcF family protein [Prosthecochloris ethylica]RNA66082.1 YdcF family protein [Prosthecochloris sp. ZM_2]
MIFRSRNTAALLALAALLTLILMSGLGYQLSRYAGEPVRSDVIIVLGGDDGLRVTTGGNLYAGGYAPHVLLTGIDKRYYTPGRPNWRERRMMDAGVPDSMIHIDTVSESSWDEAVNALERMENNNWQNALVISDPPHMLRLHNTWSKAFEGSSKRFVLVATAPEWWNPWLWWNNPTSSRFVISEVQKNLYYSLRYY